MFVKICGITRIEDAEAAVDAGASAVGFVFWPGSPRFIDPYHARRIAAVLPPFVTTVGVFVNQRTEYLSSVAALVRLGAVQLHGDETVSDVAGLARPVIKTIEVSQTAADVDAWPRRVTILLDVDDREKRGGTGRTVDWSQAATIALRRRTILAGGLTPENVADAVARVQPFGIDVSSGIERSPGVKDHGRLRALFDALTALPAAREFVTGAERPGARGGARWGWDPAAK